MATEPVATEAGTAPTAPGGADPAQPTWLERLGMPCVEGVHPAMYQLCLENEQFREFYQRFVTELQTHRDQVDLQGHASARAKDEALEPLMQDDINRLSLFQGDGSLTHPDVYALFNKLANKFWTVGEVRLMQDRRDFEKLRQTNPGMAKNLLAVLGFFVISDGVVIENLVTRLCEMLKPPESKMFIALQGGNEAVHMQQYGLLIMAIVADAGERQELFESAANNSYICMKALWAMAFIRDHEHVSLAELLVAMMCVEGISFSSSFAVVYNLRERNLMPGLTDANAMIAGDEYIHALNALVHYTKVKHKLTPEHFLCIVRGAVELECMFIDYALPEPILGLSPTDLKNYVKWNANFMVEHLSELHLPMPYPEVPRCNLAFMKKQALDMKTNFFEHQATEYQRGSVTARQADASARVGALNTDPSLHDF